MSGPSQELMAHARSGITTLCRCWSITRPDGVVHGFTDHDVDLAFDGVEFRADTGLTARALAQSTGLSVDNTEALGVLSDASVREEDIEAGRFDNADVRAWLVNWADPAQRWLQFRGSIGEIRHGGGAFQAELRGLAEALNRPLGRVYHKSCTSVLGDRACAVDLAAPGYRADLQVAEVMDGRTFQWQALSGFDAGWFERGRLDVLDGSAKGLWSAIKFDRASDDGRQIELWTPLKAPIQAGDRVRLTAGCDRRFETCRLKFQNTVNFQGFPDIPGEDWLMSVPKKSAPNTGGSLR